MKSINLQENKIMMTCLNDGTLGRFDFRGTDPNNYTLYVQLGIGRNWFDFESFYNDKIEGDLNYINLKLEQYEIIAEIISNDKKFINKKSA